MPAIFSTQPRSTDLVGVIQSIWHYRAESEFEYEQVLPGVTSQLLINLHENELRHWVEPGRHLRAIGPVGIQGVLTKPVLIDTQQKRNICGVVFSCTGLGAFCRWDAVRFTDTIVDASEIWSSSSELRAELLVLTDPLQLCRKIEEYLLDRFSIQTGANEKLTEILSLLKEGYKIGDICKHSGLSQRKLHVLFDKHIGVRPKTFERIDRFSSVLNSLPDREDLTELAFDHGYSDQSHLTREFRTFAGNAPTRHKPVPNESRHARIAVDKLFKTPGK